MATDIQFDPIVAGTTDASGRRIGVADERLSRTNYFDGQLLKASDLARDQIYIDERLLELGQVIGSGVMRGLRVSRPQPQQLRVAPGIAVAPSGRVLELSDTVLEIDLADSASLATLNDGRLQQLPRGLYLLALMRTEMVEGVAEAFPRDLAAARVMRVASFVEGVQLALWRLPLVLPQLDEIVIRAAMSRQLLGGEEHFALPTADALALALLAVDNGRLLWLDEGLVRRPLRASGAANARQQDIAAHHRELMQRVREQRQASGLPAAFAARQVFSVLPPHGPCPKDAVDPVRGSQRYFPEGWEVAIAPVRRSEVPLLLADAEMLPPIDLERDADVDLMVLVPMSDAAFALRARQLERPANPRPLPGGPFNPFGPRALAQLDPLSLRVMPLPQPHRIDTDAKVWQAIWDEALPEELVYVRRPPRAAETGVSALVLAVGAELPRPDQALPTDVAALEQELDTALERAEQATARAAALQQQQAQATARIVTLEDLVEQQRQALASSGQEPLNDALAEIATLNAEIERLRAELARLRDDARLDQLWGVAQAALAEKIEALQADLDKALAEIERLRAALEDALANGGADAQAQIAELKQALAKVESVAETQREQLRAAEAARNSAERRAAALQQQVDELRAEVARLTDTAGGSNTALDAARKQIDALNDEVRALTQRLQTATTTLDTTTRNLNQAQRDLATANAEIARLKAQIAGDVKLAEALPLQDLARLRGQQEMRPVLDVAKAVGDEPELLLAVTRLLACSRPEHDELLWPSLFAIFKAAPSGLLKLYDTVRERDPKQLPVASAMAEVGRSLGLDAALVRGWAAVLPR